MGMDVAWRINTPEAVPCNKAAAAGAGGDLICSLSTEFGLVEFSRGWPASSILRLTLSMCQGTEREYMLRYDSNARGIRPSISLSFWKHHVFHHQTSLVDCDSYEALHRTMNSTTCWNMPLAESQNTRNTCVGTIQRTHFCAGAYSPPCGA